jgi:glycerol-3-phosphate dehydrogenase
VRRSGLRGGLLNWDGQLEDVARLVVALARSAAALGAGILTRVRYDGEGRLTDQLTGASLEARAGTVVNATGAWADTITPGVRLQPSKGVHLVLDAAVLGNPTASMTVPVPGQPNRYVFALPHPDGLVYVGLTDDPVEGPLPEVPRAEEHEIAFLLDTLNRGLERPLSRTDVVGTYAGVRPLVAGEHGRTADLSRRHLVSLDDGLLTVLGGKLTTYRKMAQDAVDLLTDVPCRTQTLPLVGAGPVRSTGGPVPPRLVRRYGSEAADVAELAAGDPSLLEPVVPDAPVLGVELVWGLVAEGALCAEDLLERRTRLSLVDRWAAEAGPVVERVVAEVHAGGRA